MASIENLYGKTLDELYRITSSMNLPDYTARQISQWLYQKKVTHINDMTNLSKATRLALHSKYTIKLNAPVKIQVSSDGTKKYLFPASHDKYIETVFIPESKRNTLCVSSQIGCKMGCVFCMTGKQGFHGNLTSGEILNQLVSLPGDEKITNIVFMGMGEPMDNVHNLINALEILTADWGFGLSPSRITVSTICILPGMKEFINNSKCHLAISLNSPFHEERFRLMPVEKKYAIRDILMYLKNQSLERQRRVSFEYILFRGVNDSPSHIKELARLLNGFRCRVNLIRYHPVPGVQLESPDEETIIRFKDRLNEKGLLTTIRASRGQDIMAACGMLSTLNSSSY